MLYKRELKIHSRKFIHLSGKITPELFRHDYIIQEKKEKVQIPSNLDVIPSSRGRENTFSSNRASSRYVYIRLRIMVGKKKEIKRSFLKEELFLPENTLAISSSRNKFFPTLGAERGRNLADVEQRFLLEFLESVI